MMSPNQVPVFQIQHESSPNSIPQSDMKKNLDQQKEEVPISKLEQFASKAKVIPPDYKESLSNIKHIDEVLIFLATIPN